MAGNFDNLGGAHSCIEFHADWFDKFWVHFNTSTVNSSFDLDKYKQEIRERGGICESCGDRERGGAVQTYDDAFVADGDTDYEEEWSHETASDNAASAPEKPPHKQK